MKIGRREKLSSEFGKKKKKCPKVISATVACVCTECHHNKSVPSATVVSVLSATVVCVY